MAYDIIGDIHGQADKLEALLRTLGYRDTAGAWRHAERQAIFVGDFIDRGPAQVRSVHIVRRMVDAGAALAVRRSVTGTKPGEFAAVGRRAGTAGGTRLCSGNWTWSANSLCWRWGSFRQVIRDQDTSKGQRRKKRS